MGVEAFVLRVGMAFPTDDSDSQRTPLQPNHSFQFPSMWQAQALQFAIVVWAATAVEAVISPKVFIVDFVRKSPVASFTL